MWRIVCWCGEAYTRARARARTHTEIGSRNPSTALTQDATKHDFLTMTSVCALTSEVPRPYALSASMGLPLASYLTILQFSLFFYLTSPQIPIPSCLIHQAPREVRHQRSTSGFAKKYKTESLSSEKFQSSRRSQISREILVKQEKCDDSLPSKMCMKSDRRENRTSLSGGRCHLR